ncbi:MAG: hypothetical protein K6E51_06465 [Treponema sp.]|nr:hypothetical protein [Treponema sp.]
MIVYTWKDILQFYNGLQPTPELFSSGTALSVGSFDGPHIGHYALFDAVIKASNKQGLIPGIVTFTRPLSGMKKHHTDYQGDVSTLQQRLDVMSAKGMSFAIVIDFSDEFARMEGQLFFSILREVCDFHFLAEGKDFHCGYRGATDIEQISFFCKNNDVVLQVVPPVLYLNERVSSSRIRNDILKGDLSAVYAMLQHAYILDCTDFIWEQVVTEDSSLCFSTRNICQVLPPDGIYNCFVKLSGSKQTAAAHGAKANDAYRTTVFVESRILRLRISPDIIMSDVWTIEFIVGD